MEEAFYSNTTVYNVKNLNFKVAALLLKEKLEDNGFVVESVTPGVIVLGDARNIESQKLSEILTRYGFEIIKDKELLLVEQIKQTVIELIHQMNNMNSVVRKSEYLVEELGKSYSHLSRVFSRFELVTLEKYIMFPKIERIKYLIDEDELTLSEIAYMMDYSSVQYLSNQIKKNTGYSVTEYKSSSEAKKRYVDDMDYSRDI